MGTKKPIVSYNNQSMYNKDALNRRNAEKSVQAVIDAMQPKENTGARYSSEGILNPFVNKDGSPKYGKAITNAMLSSGNVSDKVKSYLRAASGIEEPEESKENVNSTSDQTSKWMNGNRKVGFIAEKYETNGMGPGAISTVSGDYGGTSYGTYMMATVAGTPNEFVSWLKKQNPKIGNVFGNARAGSGEFNSAWKKAANDYTQEFSNLQDAYIMEKLVMPLANLAKSKTGIDYTRSTALMELVFSTAVQFGGGSLGLSALGNVNSGMTDEQIINASYDKKISNAHNFFSGSSPSIQEAARNRFKRERVDVLNLL